MVMLGYWNQPEATDETIVDGWLHTETSATSTTTATSTSSIGRRTAIIRGGFNVFPRDVEEALLEHPASQRPESSAGLTRLTARRSSHSSSSARASGADTDDLVAFAKERIGGYKYPREVHVVPSLPLTPVGKVDRKKLRERLREEATA